MPEPAADRLVALDFSGTLSRGAVLYGRAENLKRALQEAGLWSNVARGSRTGENPLAFFWNEIVNATWEEGSTTGVGYRQLLAERLRQLAGDEGRDETLRARVSRFVDGYFRRSTIAGEWAPLLRELARRPTTVTVVATDHYAEATAHICDQLEGLGVAAAPLGSGHNGERILVANSADLGCHKSERAFWQKVKDEQGLDRPGRVVLVDDFGHNEAGGGVYGQADSVVARKERTVAILEETFAAPVAVFPFFLEDGIEEEAQRPTYERLVQEAITFVLEQI